ncbi:hypothetical protein CU103_12370 [Phyllobacterium sophorae]|uniref:Uncharacterized protein n=1 Tax=Phyllobacterium sophorae TaxID=1520277 RepID=A0A2P7BDY6_9HYPH|nr:hypothetical protein CU103_12370 [Phyllobacterium sophorae]
MISQKDLKSLLVYDPEIRARLWDGGLYVIRDVCDENNKFKGCQYAVIDENNKISWLDCIEGVLFRDIQPIGTE